MHSWMNLNGFLLVMSGRIPELLVYLVAAIWCVRNATTQRRRTILVGVAVAIEFFWSVGFLFGGHLISTAIHQLVSPLEAATVAVSLIYRLPHAVSLLLLLYAVFHGEEHRRYDDFPDDAPNS